MVGIVQHQDAGGLAAGGALGNLVGEAALQGRGLLGAQGIAPQAAVGDQAAHIVIAGQDEAAGHLVAMHRAAGPQVVQHRMGIGAIGRIERRQLKHGRQRLVGHGLTLKDMASNVP